ncbi:prolipoprotein diacylglyceryl transferase [Candidatus Woesearchaeota archaeon]|nr:prolipoprotein diacylglyceryl transferase [Candidatus Woesearchaeota archaeon]
MIDPVFLRIGSLELRYYGLIYAVMFLLGTFIIIKLAEYRREKLKIKSYQKITKDTIYDYMIYLIIGSILTARIFHIIFYNLDFYIQNPLEIIAFNHGGMSIHGGFVGGILATLLFCKKRKIHFYDIADLVMIPVALGLAVGRIGNLINQELCGKPSNVPWAITCGKDEILRHPSQIYESLKNLTIFIILLLLNRKHLKRGTIFWTFILMYGILRFSVEFFKDMPVITLGLTMGQILSVPMVIVGSIMLYKIEKCTKNHN